MRTLLGRLLLVSLLTGLLIWVTSPRVEAADYFPLKAGNCWIYYPSEGLGYRIDSIVGTEMVDTTLTYIWKRLEAPPDNYHERRWLVKDGVDLKALQYWSNELEPPSAVPILLDPPLSFGNIVDPIVGDSWQVEVDIGTSHVKTTYWVESITATVTVPAGRFSNCVRVRQEDEITTGTSTEYKYKKYWLAPEVGTVMYKKFTRNWATVKKTQKLVAYSLE